MQHNVSACNITIWHVRNISINWQIIDILIIDIDNDIMIFIHVILLRIDKFAFILFAQTGRSIEHKF